jgi:hypothetical protein
VRCTGIWEKNTLLVGREIDIAAAKHRTQSKITIQSSIAEHIDL